MKKKILVVGLGNIGKRLVESHRFEGCSHSDAFEKDFSAYTAVVNCAGIGGYGKCAIASIDAVIKANVKLPLRLAAACEEADVHFIQLSTAGIYAKQVCPHLEDSPELASRIYQCENSPIKKHNLYVESKILMEEALDAFPTHIFRFCFYLSDTLAKRSFASWNQVQSTYLSILRHEILEKAILRVVDLDIPTGVYNIASDVVWLPDLARRYGFDLPERDSYPEDMTASVPISTQKAVSVGLLDTREKF